MLDLPTLQSIASQAAGTPVAISCDAPSTFDPGVLGYVIFIDGVVVPMIHLPRATCTRLEHADTGDLAPSDFLTLTHEATHIATGSQNECDVERSALANAWQVVRLFRLAAWRARAILAGLRQADAHLMPEYHAGCTL